MRRAADLVARAAWVLRRVIGAPDYAAYLEHMRRAHSGTAPMSAREFERERLARRYAETGSRCC